jgi:hypothetical protein
MNIKEARKIQPGALVRTSWATNNNATQGIVLAKEYERALGANEAREIYYNSQLVS